MCFFRRKQRKINPNLNIETKDLVTFHKLRRKRLFLGTKINIPRNFAFAICSNDKVLDILYEDKELIKLDDLPNATRKLGLYKVNKKGRPPKFFEADTYFVNMNFFENFKWGTSSYAELEDKNFGDYRTYCYGNLNFKIVEPIRFLNYLLGEAEIIKLYPNESTKIVSRFINERSVRIINKINPTAKSLYLKDKEITKKIFEKLSMFLCEIGIGLNYLSLTEAKFPPKIYNELKKINKKPIDESYWEYEKVGDNCGIGTPLSKDQGDSKFITIIPTGVEVPFFRECMAPYFFDEEEIEKEKELKEAKENGKKEDPQKEPIWQGVDEKIFEEESKQLVDLNDRS